MGLVTKTFGIPMKCYLRDKEGIADTLYFV